MRSNTPSSAQHRGVDERLVDLAVVAPPRRGPARTPAPARASPGRARRRWRPRCVASANQSVRTNPSNPHSSRKHLVEQPRAVGAVLAVEAVVRRHDPEGAALANGQLERHQVDLAQRAVVDHGVGAHPVELGLVADEVLHRGGHALGLRATDERGRQSAREQRVLRVALEVAPAERRAVEVHRRREQHPARLGARLLAEECPDPLHELEVPGGAEGRPARHAHRRSTHRRRHRATRSPGRRSARR